MILDDFISSDGEAGLSNDRVRLVGVAITSFFTWGDDDED